MALCRQVQLHRRLDAYRQHVLFQQERGNIEGEWREVPVVTAQQPAVQPDVGHQECAVETQEGALAVPWPGKTDAIPDRLVAAGGAVEARHHGRRPGIVIAVDPRKAAVFPLAERRDRHPPPGIEFLSVQRLGGKQRETIVQRHVRPPFPA